jgi:hypothetical protein
VKTYAPKWLLGSLWIAVTIMSQATSALADDASDLRALKAE